MFAITAKTDYGLLFLLALAKRDGKKPQSLKKLAKEEHLPYRFLTQIVIPLRKAKLVESKEGSGGGYRLTDDAGRISLSRVFHALGNDTALVRCLRDKDGNCPHKDHCSLPSFWSVLSMTLKGKLDSVTLADLLVQTKK